MVGEKLEAERRKYSNPSYWDQEMEIQYDAMQGQRVYPEFSELLHVVPHCTLPYKMCRYMAIDPHPRTPHAFLWVGVDAYSDMYVYRELWPSVACGRSESLRDNERENSYTIREYAETVAWSEGNSLEWRNAETDDEYAIYRQSKGPGTHGEDILIRYMDQAGKGFRASADGAPEEFYSTRYSRFGIACADPYKSHASGEDAIRNLLVVRKHDRFGTWPRLHISNRCPETILEFQRYRYKTMRRPNDERELHQEGIESRCHMLDLLRYIAVSKPYWSERLASYWSQRP
jgi:hypothetical protein